MPSARAGFLRTRTRRLIPAPSPFSLLQLTDAATEYRESVLPELQAAQQVRLTKENEQRDVELTRLRKDVFGSEEAIAADAIAAAAGAAGEGERDAADASE